MTRILFLCCFALCVGVACSGSTDDPANATALTAIENTTTIAPETTSTTSAPETTVETTSTVATSTTVLSTTAPSTTAASAEAPVDPEPGDLVGRWAHFDVVAYQDGDFKTLIVSYGFNDFADVDGGIEDSASFCFSDQVTNQPITTSMSDAATQAIKPPPAPLGVDVTDGVLTIRRDATPTPVGIRLEDPANESLPTDPNDPRIVDDDGDGNPGITVTIDVGGGITGELYIARREVFAYDAELVGADLIEGVVEDRSEQLAIGASNPLFLQSSAWNQVEDPALNPIILKRVDDDWDCDRLAAERDDLFPPTPMIDW